MDIQSAAGHTYDQSRAGDRWQVTQRSGLDRLLSDATVVSFRSRGTAQDHWAGLLKVSRSTVEIEVMDPMLQIRLQSRCASSTYI